MRALSVIVRVEGLTFVIEGEEERVSTAVSVIESLLALAEIGETVDRGRVEYCLELASEGKASDITKISSDTVAITYRGKPIKSKTVGQKKIRRQHKKRFYNFRNRPCRHGQNLSCRVSCRSGFQIEAGG